MRFLFDRIMIKPITILTFNAGLLDINLFGLSFFKPAAYIEKRTEAIAKQLKDSNADIIALQEVYLRKHHRYFIEELEEVYPYHAYPEMQRFNWGSGLMTFSKFPMIEWNFTPFVELGTVDEKIFTKRGMLNASVKICGSVSINIVNIHLTSGGVFHQMDDKKIEQKRSKQIEEVLRVANETKTEGVIILGDFNLGPRVSTKNYEEVLHYGFKDVYDVYCRAHQLPGEVTWDITNPLIVNQFGVGSNRLDHIMIKKEHWNVLDADVVFKEPIVSIGNKKVTLSDHYGLEATLKL